MRKRPTVAALQKLCSNFNAAYPVGTRVILIMDTGIARTVVDSPAHVLGGHSAVAWFEGVRGAYSIENNRVTKDEDHAS